MTNKKCPVRFGCPLVISFHFFQKKSQFFTIEMKKSNGLTQFGQLTSEKNVSARLQNGIF